MNEDKVDLRMVGIPRPDAAGDQRDSKGVFGQPPILEEEVSRLTFGKLGDIRVRAQERQNQFAHLLNRGSSME
jgi:hypothetical protein